MYEFIGMVEIETSWHIHAKYPVAFNGPIRKVPPDPVLKISQSLLNGEQEPDAFTLSRDPLC